MPVSDKQVELHASLKRFYNTGAEYFSEASQVNCVVTPERAKLLSSLSREIGFWTSVAAQETIGVIWRMAFGISVVILATLDCG
jgi:hypothetical protein